MTQSKSDISIQSYSASGAMGQLAFREAELNQAAGANSRMPAEVLNTEAYKIEKEEAVERTQNFLLTIFACMLLFSTHANATISYDLNFDEHLTLSSPVIPLSGDLHLDVTFSSVGPATEVGSVISLPVTNIVFTSTASSGIQSVVNAVADAFSLLNPATGGSLAYDTTTNRLSFGTALSFTSSSAIDILDPPFSTTGSSPLFALTSLSTPLGLLTFGEPTDINFSASGDPISLSSAVPEPSTWIMMVMGFIGLGTIAYRRTHGPRRTWSGGY